MEAESALLVSARQTLHEETTEQSCEHVDGQKETLATTKPALSINKQAAARYLKSLTKRVGRRSCRS